MKKIIGIILILLFTTTVFGQRFLNRKSAIVYGTWQDKTNLVHFTTESGNNKFFYILAYEPYVATGYSNTTRNVYLYCININPDNGAIFREHYNWIRACDEPILVHYYRDADNYREADFYLYDEQYQNTSHSSVIKIGNDIEFTLDIIDMIGGGFSKQQVKIKLKCIQDRGSDGYFYKLIK